MPDGIAATRPRPTAPELAADTADSRLLRHVRRNLVLWSGGTTLLVLRRRWPRRSTSPPRARSRAPARTSSSSAPMSPGLSGERPDPDDRSAVRLHLRRRRSGPIALILDPDGSVVLGPREQRPPPGPARYGRAVAGRGATSGIGHHRRRRPSAATIPVRVLTETVDVAGRAASTPSRSSRTGPPSSRRSRSSCSSCSSVGGLVRRRGRSASGPSTPAGRSSRSANRSRTSASRCAASASSRPTPATSCGRR